MSTPALLAEFEEASVLCHRFGSRTLTERMFAGGRGLRQLASRPRNRRIVPVACKSRVRRLQKDCREVKGVNESQGSGSVAKVDSNEAAVPLIATLGSRDDLRAAKLAE